MSNGDIGMTTNGSRYGQFTAKWQAKVKVEDNISQHSNRETLVRDQGQAQTSPSYTLPRPDI